MNAKLYAAIYFAAASGGLYAADGVKGKVEGKVEGRVEDEAVRKARMREISERGKKFEDEVHRRLDDRAKGRFDEQVRVRSNESGLISRPDFVVVRTDREIVAVDAKAGETARLRRAQRALREEGGIVVSSNKEGVAPGDRIAPNRFAVIRDEAGNKAAAARDAAKAKSADQGKRQ